MALKSPPFNHFIITRFNLRKEEWSHTREKSLVLTDEWLSNRFVLFENYCFPSVCNQENKNFKWLVYFDTNTPDHFKSVIKKLETLCSQFEPIFVDGMNEFLPGIKERLIENNSSYIITTRLDNDDCIAANFTEVIQNKFVPVEFKALDFPKGYTLKIEPEFQLGKKIQAYNPFISLIELNENPETVWSRSHGSWKREKRMDRDMNHLIWMSIIHKENKVNDFTGYGNTPENTLEKFISRSDLLSRIKGELQLGKKNSMESATNRVVSYIKLYSKDFKRFIGL